jgi:hypothetical protein
MTEPTLNDVRKVVGAHGHGFQYAVLRRAEELSTQGLSNWVFEAAEFPVGNPDNPIHVDFVLRDARATVYLVVECKRADPARANWCFLKAPYTRRNAYEREVVFQEVHYEADTLVAARPRTASASVESTHLGLELRAGGKGDGVTTGSAIKDATAQVLRGANGLLDHLFPGQRMARGQKGNSVVFVPVIFTTARLWVAKGDLSAADLTTGLLPEEWGALTSMPWLWYTHNQSPALRHRLPSSSPTAVALSAALHAEYSRTIAVVSPGGIDAFLCADLVSWL